MGLKGTYHQVAAPSSSLLLFDLVFFPCPHSFTPLLSCFQSHWPPGLQTSRQDKIVLQVSEDALGLPLFDSVTLEKLLMLLEPIFFSINEHATTHIAGLQ